MNERETRCALLTASRSMRSQRSPLGLDGRWPDAHAFMFLLQLADRHAHVWVREHGYGTVDHWQHAAQKQERQAGRRAACEDRGRVLRVRQAW